MKPKFKVLEGYYTFDQAEKAIPEGFRLMSEEEFETLIKETDYHFDYRMSEGVFTWKDGSGELRLSLNGLQNSENGEVYCRGEEGYYQAFSIPNDMNVRGLYFDNFRAGMFDGDKGCAHSVLCVEKEPPSLKIKDSSIIRLKKFFMKTFG